MESYIKTHKEHIDSLLDEILKIEYININNIILSILSGNFSTNLLSTPSTSNSIINNASSVISSVEKLHSFLKRWCIEKNGDLAGYIYINLQNRTSKKSKGQYFTPPSIVNKIVEDTITKENYENIKILDPACGSGQFLIAAFSKLLHFHLQDNHDAKEASLHIVSKNLFGIDLDPIALEICKFNLHSIAGNFNANLNLTKANALEKNTLYFSNEVNNKLFDYVFANPPWGAKLSSSEKSHYRKEFSCSQSGINSFTLFLERAVELLEEKGKLGFLIPEAYLNIKAHEKSRKDLLSFGKLKTIHLWGEQFKTVFAPSISIIFEKTLENKNENVVQIVGKEEMKKNTMRLVPQKYFSKTPNTIFNINYSGKTEFLLETLSLDNCIYLHDNAKFFLGIVTGKNKETLFTEKTEEHPDPIIVSQDIKPYKIRDAHTFFKFNPEDLQQSAPQAFYKTTNKFLYRFIGNRLTFALDTKGNYSINNANGFIPTSLFLSNETILSLLNSSLIQYYYHNSFFTLKVLKGNLEKIPLKIISKDTQDKLAKLTFDITQSNNENYIKTTMENIDDIVFHEYGINDKNAFKVYNTFSPAQLSQDMIN